MREELKQVAKSFNDKPRDWLLFIADHGNDEKVEGTLYEAQEKLSNNT